MLPRFVKISLFLLAIGLFGSLGVNRVHASNVSATSSILYLSNNSNSAWTKNGNTYTKSVEVPTSCANPFFLMTTNLWYSHQPNTIKYNDVSFTKAGEYNIDSEKHMSIWYLVAPASGTHTLTFSEDYGDRPLQFILFCDVDPDTPFATSFTQQAENTNTNININEDTTAILAVGISDNFNSWPEGFSLISNTGSTGEQTYVASKNSISTSNLNYNVGNGIGAYALLNYKPAISCGDGVCNGTETFLTCSADCPATWTWASVIAPDYSAGQRYGMLSEDQLISVVPYVYDVNVDIATPDYITIALCTNDSCSTSQSLYFDNGSATSSTFEIVRPTSTSYVYGTGAFELSSDHARDYLGTTTSDVLHYKVIPYYQIALGVARQGLPAYFTITWLGSPDVIPDSYLAGLNTTTGSTSDETLVGTFLNWGGDFLKGIFKPILWGLKQIFPFNIPIIIGTAWSDSADAPMPADTAVFDPLDGSGNLTIDLPAAQNVVVFGPSVLISTTTSAWYDGVRHFSTYLFYFLFACLAVFVGYKVFNLMSGRDDFTFERGFKTFYDTYGRPQSVSQTYRSKRGRGSKTYSKRL